MVRSDRAATRLVYIGAAAGLLLWLLVYPSNSIEMSAFEWGQYTPDFWPLLTAGAFLLAGMLLGATARTYRLTGRPPRPWGPGAPSTLTRTQSAIIGGTSGLCFSLAWMLGRYLLPWQVPATGASGDPVVVSVEPLRIVVIALVPLAAVALVSEACFAWRERQEAGPTRQLEEPAVQGRS